MTDAVTAAIRRGYDRLAAEYARRIAKELEYKPFDRDLLTRLIAETAGRGELCDLGCGPGHVARFLRDAGASVFGIDLSPGMVDEARRLHPDIAFREGNMMALDIPDDTLAGIAAFYSIVNLPRESLPVVFREMERVLRPGGLTLIAFHAGDEAHRVQKVWGQSVSMEFFHFPPAVVREDITHAGLRIEALIEREPYAEGVEYQSRRAYIFARKPIV